MTDSDSRVSGIETGDQPTFSIHPEPSAEELVAITATVVAILRASSGEAAPQPVASRWSRAGRAEAMRGDGNFVDRP